MVNPGKKALFPLILILSLITILSCRECELNKSFRGQQAFTHVERIVKMGPRVPGTEGSTIAQDYIMAELTGMGVKAERQPFLADTPAGPVSMANVIGKIGKYEEIDKDSKIIVVGTHYDTKIIEGIPDFAGANDGTSGVGVLLELANVLSSLSLNNGVWLVFFDGEESYEEKHPADWFYGSRHFVSRFTEEGLAHTIKYMVLLDMVGDKDLNINKDINSSVELTQKVSVIARKLGYPEHFSGFPIGIRDDHIPFIDAGIPAIDIIDFTYGGSSSPGYYWHTGQDTIDKVSPDSLKIVGDVVLNLVLELDKEI